MLRPRFRNLVVALPPVVLIFWLWIAGTYSPVRDIGGIIIATLAVGLLLASRQGPSLRSPSGASSLLPLFKQAVSPSVSLGWLLLCWITLSLLDAAFEARPLPLRGNILEPAAMTPALGKLRIGLALSGGGYRAALVHAGVLQELSAHGVPVTNIGSVSGGSIIGAFLSRGGDPADFVLAVKDGRFRLKRELLSALNLPRWLFPFCSFSRRDVQAGLVRRVLLAAEPASGAGRKTPALMLAMTDLSRAISVGATDAGFILAGPTTSRFFKNGDAIAIDGLGDLATKVAISGAFPGAFPAYETKARFTVNPEPLSTSSDIREITLTLVDGGVRDNLGLRLLEVVNEHARGTNNISLPWIGFQPGPEWALDIVIISDGGKSLEADESGRDELSRVMRAIDLAGIDTGIFRPITMSSELPKVALSLASGLEFAPDAVIAGFPHLKSARERYFFFQPDQLSDESLDRIVALVPAPAQAQQALSAYRRTKGPINLSVVDAHCVISDPAYRDSPECRWWDLVRMVGADIEKVTTVFRDTETLQDHYRSDDADALVRLGRYFVLLKWKDIQEAVTLAADRKS